MSTRRLPDWGEPVIGARAWWGALLLLVAIRAGLTSLGSLLAPGSWLTSATLAAAAVLLAAAATRQLGSATWAPPAALGVGALVVVVGYGGAGTGPAVPGTQTLGRLRDLVELGAQAIADGRTPVDPVRGIELLVVLAAVVVTVVADALALGLRLAGPSGVVIASLWVPTLMFSRPPSTVGVLVAGVAWLGLLWLTKRTRGPARPLWREAPVALAVTAAAAVAAIVLGPLAAVLPGYGSTRLPAMWSPGGGGASSTSLAALDMRADLGDRPTTEVLRYTSERPYRGPMRTTTLLDFDGETWHAGAGGVTVAADGVLWPSDVVIQRDGSTDEIVGEGGAVDLDGGEATVTMDVTLTSATTDGLPIPTEPREISAPGLWEYDARRDAVTGPVAAGLRYEVVTAARDLSAEVLRADVAEPRDPGDPELAVPDTAYIDRVAELAHDVVGDATTAYDQAVALQTWFRSSEFTYTTELPPAQTSDALWDFLTARSGYCVQFATAMAVMARQLGIPSRVAVGYLPGTRDDSGTVVITADRAHAWPELWFADAGWVRFEPTPAVQTGLAPAYSDPTASSTTAPDDAPSLGPTTQPDSSEQPPASTAQTDTPTQDAAGVTRWLLLGVAVVLVALVAGVVIVLRRRRPARGPEEAWALLRRRAERVGLEWNDATTPRQAGRALHAALDSPGPAPSAPTSEQVGEAHRAVDQLVATVEAFRYAPDPSPVDDDELNAWLQAASRPLSAARADGAPSAPRGG